MLRGRPSGSGSPAFVRSHRCIATVNSSRSSIPSLSMSDKSQITLGAGKRDEDRGSG